MKFVSWNVNGIRAVLKKGFLESVRGLDADIYCLQETRALPEQVDLEMQGYDAYWNPAEKKGYSGTLVLSRIPVERFSSGIGISNHDKEGRVITAELSDFYLVTVYTPNSQRGLARLDYRTTEWDVAFLNYVQTLEKEKPVIFCGDLNVAHKEIDLANPKSNRKNAGFTDEERAGFDAIVEAGFVDTFRMFCDEGGQYTWWSNFGKARERNVGWRIDYFCVSSILASRVEKAEIHSDIVGSDHCPISLEIS